MYPQLSIEDRDELSTKERDFIEFYYTKRKEKERIKKRMYMSESTFRRIKKNISKKAKDCHMKGDVEKGLKCG